MPLGRGSPEFEPRQVALEPMPFIALALLSTESLSPLAARLPSHRSASATADIRLLDKMSFKKCGLLKKEIETLKLQGMENPWICFQLRIFNSHMCQTPAQC